jgi:hypothetical protein
LFRGAQTELLKESSAPPSWESLRLYLHLLAGKLKFLSRLMVPVMVTSEKIEMLGPRHNVILIFVALQEVHMWSFTNADSKCLSSF